MVTNKQHTKVYKSKICNTTILTEESECRRYQDMQSEPDRIEPNNEGERKPTEQMSRKTSP